MNMIETSTPRPEDIQKEFEKFVKDRFGQSVKVVSQDFSGLKDNSEASDTSSATKDVQTGFSVDFDYKPIDVKEHLDRFVIDQDEAKRAISIAVCDHYNQVKSYLKTPQNKSSADFSKQNVLILGPTGVGKTYLVRQVAKLIGVPFVKADATRFSETGYVGANVDDLIKDLVNQVDGDIEQAKFGIIYLDEVDKLAVQNHIGGRDVSGRGVQMGLLKIMEETDVDLRSGNDPASQIQALLEMQQKGKIKKNIINTRHILFIVSGAFTGLEDIITKRLNRNKIGFQHTNDKRETAKDLLPSVTTQDFIDYGFEPEFIGRLPVRVACRSLKISQLLAILKNSEGSILRQYEAAFSAYGIKLTLRDDALELIARRAQKEKTGARGLMTTLEQILRDFKFHLPSSSIRHFVVDKDLIEKPKDALEKLLLKFSISNNKDCATNKLSAEKENRFASNDKLQGQEVILL